MGRRPISHALGMAEGHALGMAEGHALGMAEGHAVVRGPMALWAMGPEPRAQLRWALKNKILKYGPNKGP